jgi:hypothetical protein
MGIDLSKAFIKAADTMRVRGSMAYYSVMEGDIKVRKLICRTLDIALIATPGLMPTTYLFL